MSNGTRTKPGRYLAGRLVARHLVDPVVVVMAGGAVHIGWEIAHRLRAPIDVLAPREIIVPGWRQVHVGAVAGEVSVMESSVIAKHALAADYVGRLATHESRIAGTQEAILRGGQGRIDVAGRDVVLVDNGWASLLAMRAALQALTSQGARSIVLATPHCDAATLRAIRTYAMVESYYPVDTSRSILIGDENLFPATREETMALIEKSRFPGEKCYRPFAAATTHRFMAEALVTH